jgi:hypothetical protein
MVSNGYPHIAMDMYGYRWMPDAHGCPASQSRQSASCMMHLVIGVVASKTGRVLWCLDYEVCVAHERELEKYHNALAAKATQDTLSGFA